MACNFKHSQKETEEEYADFAKLRVLFIKRMTEDSGTHDRRRKDYNQAIFNFREDGSTFACFNDTDMDMVLTCFDNAVKDWRNGRKRKMYANN